MTKYANLKDLTLSDHVAALNHELTIEDNGYSDDVLALNPELASLLGKGQKRSKYGNVRCEFDGLKFASKAEMKRYGDLRLLELTKEISDLTVQPVYELTGKVKYRGDFQYVENGRIICEDVKGGRATATAVFKVKWKQAKELYPNIEFRLIER